MTSAVAVSDGAARRCRSCCCSCRVASASAPLTRSPPPPMPSTVAIMLRIERVRTSIVVGSSDAPVSMFRFVSTVPVASVSTFADVDRATSRAGRRTPRPRGRRQPETVSVAAPPTPEKRPLSLPAMRCRSTIRLAGAAAGRGEVDALVGEPVAAEREVDGEVGGSPPSSGLKPLVFVIDDEMPIGVPAERLEAELVGAEAVVSTR